MVTRWTAQEAFVVLRNRSLLELFPREDVANWAGKASIHYWESGEEINRVQAKDRLHLIVEGQVSLWNAAQSEVQQKIAPGRSIELASLLSTDVSRWKFRWFADEKTVTVSIPWEEVRRSLDRQPMMSLYLQRVTQFPELLTLKRDLGLLGLSKAERIFVVASMKESEWSGPGAIDAGRRLCVVRSGGGRVCTRIGTSDVVLAEMSSGDYFFEAPSYEFRAVDGTKTWTFSLDLAPPGVHDKLLTLDTLLLKRERLLRQEENRAKELQLDEEEPIPEDDDGFEVSHFKVKEGVASSSWKKKFPWLQQHDQMDCGAACLAMVSRYYGRRINIATWRNLVHITREGASMLSLKRAAERVGFDVIGVMSGYKALQSLQAPMIALMQYHFVVVYEITPTHVVVADPASSLKKMPREEFLKEYSNNVLLLKPNERLKQFPESKNTFRKYLSLFQDSRLQLMEIVLLSVVVFVLGLAVPLFLQFIFDNVLATRDAKKLLSVTLLFIGLALASVVSENVRTVLLSRLTSRLDAKFSSLFLGHVFRLPLNYFAVRNVGDITTRMGELAKIRQFFSSKLVVTFINVFSLAIYLYVLRLYSPALVWVFLPCGIIFTVFLAQLMVKFRANLQETFKAAGKSQSITFEQVKNVETLQGLGALLPARWRWEETLVNQLRLTAQLERLMSFLGAFSGLFKELTQWVLLIVAIVLYFGDHLTLGQVVAAYAFAENITTPLMQLLQEWHEFGKVGVSLEKVDEIMTSPTEEQNVDLAPLSFARATTGIHSLSAPQDIEFENVFFQYGSDASPMVLQGVSLRIPKGSTVAFVGSSGSGKSTLAYMLNRLYAPTRGTVRIGGVDVAEMPLSELRRRVGMVSQDNRLFAGSFLFNISLGDTAPDLERAMSAARLACAHDFILEKPGGYHYELGEGGSGISGGQKQRINLARAIYRNPEILVLDEATSALDARTERVIVENLKGRGANKTTVIIAHRLNTVTHADFVFTFHRGKLIESGTHHSLIQKQGKYFRMFRQQLEVA